jgi:hypothetical protein
MDLAGVLERGPQKIATLLDSNDIYMTFSEFQNFRNHPQISKKHDVLWFLPPGAFLGDVVEATDGTTTSGRSDDPHIHGLNALEFGGSSKACRFPHFSIGFQGKKNQKT